MFDVGSFRSLTGLFVNPTFAKGEGFGGSVLSFTLVSEGAFPSFLRINLGTFFIVRSSIHCWLG